MIKLKLISAFTLTASVAAISAGTAAPAFAQDGPQAEESASPQDAIIVTGTRRTDRTVADSPVPVDIISSEALQNSGATETNRLLNNLVPSFNFPQPSLTDGTDSLRPATLRGLAPDQVLVLVNGKRRHLSSLLNLNGSVGRGSAGVDMNTIPPIAIERIEVLRDGASSLYGSDAIAGVINIQLKKREGGRAQISYGKYVTSMEGVGDVTGVTQPTTATGDPTVTLSTSDRKRRDGETYAWEDFESDFGLNQQFMQPRFGFTAHVTYKDWPVVAIAEALSSPSGYTKMTYAGTVGFGKTFFNWDTSMNFSFLAGYKYVLDEGFGSNTIINSVRDDFMRERLSTFFNPTNPLGRKLGNLLVVRGGVGKVFGWEQEWSAGVDVYGELDLLEKSVRFSRMTNVGAMLWLRYRL